MSAVLNRIRSNAEALLDRYPSANVLLKATMKDAMPWAVPLAMQGTIPALDKIERLATQLIAIMLASEPERSPREDPDDTGAPAARIHQLKW